MDRTLILRALADETRWKILSLLSESQYCVRALSDLIGISQSAVSQHLKLLREANIVVGEKRGYYTHYIVQNENIKRIGKTLIAFADSCEALRCEYNCPLTSNNHKEENMEKTKCKKPENLKGKPEECSPEQIKECHGDEKQHECVEPETKCKKPENLKGKPGECSPEQIKECHGDEKEHECV